jgi:hypothetical protein
MRPNISVLTLLATATLVTATAVMAQEQPAPSASSSTPPSTVAIPARGSTMETVKSKFGAPTQEIAAVGRPPITRWEYPGYVVFFENDRVLHTVISR